MRVIHPRYHFWQLMTDAYTIRQQSLDRVAEICVALGIRHFVVAPGSRSAPLVTALARRDELTLRVVVDERSAGYVALGMAQQLRNAVGLVCTSGTAALNFASAVTEAFYQRVPLLVLTADRPPEWIDQADNQAIHQPHLYEPHILASFEFPDELSHPDRRWHGERMIAQAIQLSQTPVMGPVHINFPLREPLYPASGDLLDAAHRGRTIRTVESKPQLSITTRSDLLHQWAQAERKLIIAGMHAPDARLRHNLALLSQHSDVAVIADITANLFPNGTPLHHGDMILGSRNATVQDALTADLVITFGGQVVSKYWKTVLRQRPPHSLWHVQPGNLAPDTFQALTHHVAMEAGDFFETIADNLPVNRAKTGYAQQWLSMEQRALAALNEFFKEAKFGEFVATHQVLAALPSDGLLQLGNSMPIRYANFVGHLPNMGETIVNANRGASGIDGTVSTAVGAAVASGKPTTLIVGDLAFFYDRNGLWQADLPPNLRIVVLNNHGGGIFDIIEGPNKLGRATQERFFLTPQSLSARRTAEDHGLTYYFADDRQTLAEALPKFFASTGHAALLEIESDMATNTQVFNHFRQVVAGLDMR